MDKSDAQLIAPLSKPERALLVKLLANPNRVHGKRIAMPWHVWRVHQLSWALRRAVAPPLSYDREKKQRARDMASLAVRRVLVDTGLVTLDEGRMTPKATRFETPSTENRQIRRVLNRISEINRPRPDHTETPTEPFGGFDSIAEIPDAPPLRERDATVLRFPRERINQAGTEQPATAPRPFIRDTSSGLKRGRDTRNRGRGGRPSPGGPEIG